MRQQCIDAVNAVRAARNIKPISPKEAENIDNRITHAKTVIIKRDREAYLAMTPEARLQAATKLVADDILSDSIQKKRRLLKDVATESRHSALAEASGLSPLDFLGRTATSRTDQKSNVQSLESAVRADVSVHMAKLGAVYESAGIGSMFNLLSDSKAVKLLEDEMSGIDSGNALAKSAAKEFREFYDSLLTNFNAAGGHIRRMENHGPPQAWDSALVYKKELQPFIESMQGKVNPEAYVNPDGSLRNKDQMDAFFKHVWESISYNGLLTKGEPTPGGRSIGNSRTEGRQIIFKDVESYRAAMDELGQGSFTERLRTHVHGMVRDTVAMEIYGTNPDAFFARKLLEARQAEAMNGVPAKKIDAMAKDAQKAFDYAMGRTGDGAETLTHQIGQGARDIVGTAAKLGSLLFAQIIDVAQMTMTARAIGAPVLRQFYHAYDMKSAEGRAMAIAHGVAIEGIGNHMAIYGEQSSQGWTGKVASTVVEMQGAATWTRAMRAGSGLLAQSHIADLVNKHATLSAADDWSQNFFRSKGVTEETFAIWKAAQKDVIRGQDYLTPGSVEGISLDDIKTLIPGKIAEIEATAQTTIDGINERIAKVSSWVAGRSQKLSDYMADKDAELGKYEMTRAKNLLEMKEDVTGRGGALWLKEEKAEIDAQIAKEVAANQNAGRTSKFFDALKRGVEHYGLRRNDIGERLGMRRHSMEVNARKAELQMEGLQKGVDAKEGEMYAPEKQKDGIISMGRVVEAEKGLDAFVAKQRDIIETLQEKINKGRSADLKIERAAMIQKAEARMEDAALEFEALRQNADDALMGFKANANETSQGAKARIDVANAKLERARVEADVAAYLITQKKLGQFENALDTLEFGNRKFADRAFDIGEQLGARKASIENRIKNMDKQVDDYARSAGKEVYEKAEKFDTLVAAREKKLEVFTKEMMLNIDRLVEMADSYRSGVGGKIEEAAIAARRDATLKAMGTVIEIQDISVLQPTGQENLGQFFNYDKSTWGGQVQASVAQFKKFPWMYLKRNLDMAASKDGYSRIEYVAGLTALSTVLGGVSLVLGDIALGNDPRKIFDSDPKTAMKFAAQAWMRGGGLGPLSDALFAREARGEKIAKNVAGPVLSQAFDALDIAYKARGELAEEFGAEEKNRKIAEAMVKFAKNSTPGQNLWMTKAATDRWIFNQMREWANPGAIDRMKERGEKERGVGQWWDSGSMTPERAPDMRGMMQ